MSEERPGGYGRERPLEPREEPRLLAAILGSVGDAILVTEARSINEPGPRIVYANESFTRMTGYTAEELVGKTPRVLQGPLTDRSRLNEIRTALTRRESVRVDLLNYHKDGTQFWVEVNIAPLTDEHGNHTHWVSVQRDITERRRQQQALKESEERLRTILVQYASDIITILEPDGTIRYESPAVESVLGYEPQELVDENILDYIHPEDIEVTMGEIGRGLEDTEVRASLLASSVAVAGYAVAGQVPWHGFVINALGGGAGEATGVGVVTTILLVGLRPFPSIWSTGPRRWPREGKSSWEPIEGFSLPKRHEIPEIAGQAALLVATMFVAYGTNRGVQLDFAYLVFLPLIWVAVRSDLARTAVCVLLINVGAIF